MVALRGKEHDIEEDRNEEIKEMRNDLICKELDNKLSPLPIEYVMIMADIIICIKVTTRTFHNHIPANESEGMHSG